MKKVDRRTPQQILVDYMKNKEKKLQELTGLKDAFFNKSDEKEILSWESKACNNVIYKMKGKSGFGHGTCPFCVYNGGSWLMEPNCKGCLYGKNHIVCFNADSLYSKFEAKTSIIDREQIFANEFLKKAKAQ